jgi:hypothetical protein
MKRGRGRPPGTCKPIEKRLTEVVNVRFRVTTPEYDALCIRAVRERKSVGELARELLLAQFSVTKNNRRSGSSPTLGA